MLAERAIFLPWLGEFGVMLLRWVRYVHWHPAACKVVCCRTGQEPLFPSAASFIYDWPDLLSDADRVGDAGSHNDAPALLKFRTRLAQLFPDYSHVLPHRDRVAQ